MLGPELRQNHPCPSPQEAPRNTAGGRGGGKEGVEKGSETCAFPGPQSPPHTQDLSQLPGATERPLTLPASSCSFSSTRPPLGCWGSKVVLLAFRRVGGILGDPEGIFAIV